MGNLSEKTRKTFENISKSNFTSKNTTKAD